VTPLNPPTLDLEAHEIDELETRLANGGPGAFKRLRRDNLVQALLAYAPRLLRAAREVGKLRAELDAGRDYVNETKRLEAVTFAEYETDVVKPLRAELRASARDLERLKAENDGLEMGRAAWEKRAELAAEQYRRRNGEALKLEAELQAARERIEQLTDLLELVQEYGELGGDDWDQLIRKIKRTLSPAAESELQAARERISILEGAPCVHPVSSAQLINKPGKVTCVYLRDKTKVVLRREGNAAWLSVVPTEMIELQENAALSPAASESEEP